jgi:hypothetical protein
LSIWIALALWAAEVVVIAALATTRRGARLGVWLAIALLPLPVFVQESWWPPVFVLEVALLFAMFRAADLASDRSLATFPRRLGHLVSLPDSRRVQRGLPPRFNARALLKLVVAGAIVAAAWWVVGAADRFDGWRHYALRWYVGGGPLPFAMVACLDAVLAFVLAALGRAMPPVNRAPYLATSLSDFWSRRWNSIINSVLRDHVYRRLANRGALMAMTATFVVSAVLHAYLIGMLTGVLATVAWTVFFLAQIAFMWIERRLRVRKWRPGWGHVWTLGSLALLYPLFVEPLLVLFERV